MKKFLMTIAAVALVAVSANAQDEKWFGSREGGFAITFNANPILNYAGNMFNGNTGNSLADFEGTGIDGLFTGTTITGKYFLKDNMAVNLGFGYNNKYNVTNNYNDPSDAEAETGFSRTSTTEFALKAGLEYRLQPGKRIQPIFGADLVYAHTNGFTYIESEDDKDGMPSGDWKYNGAPVNKLGLMLNVGVEYFIIPQMSVGAELGFGVAKQWNRTSQDSSDEDKIQKKVSRVNTSTLDLKTGDVFGHAKGNISLNFYF
jgi:opacity protein-like surface antigen